MSKLESAYTLLLAVVVTLLMIFSMSCTFTITTVHTQGTASDVVEEESEAEPDISTDLSVPLIGK